MRPTRSPRSTTPRSLQRRLRAAGGSILTIGLVLTTAAAFLATPAGAATAIGLGTASSFAVLSGQGITNTGVTTIRGDVGTSPNPSMTGFGPGANQVVLVPPSKIATATEAAQAQDDLTTGYDQAAAASPRIELASAELGGRTLTPGVYHNATLGLTGTLTLDAQGNPDAVFIFQSDSTLITAAGSQIVVINGTTCNVFFQVGSSATLGEASAFLGTILAHTSISVGTDAVVEGRLLARTGSVTLLSNRITLPTCAAPPPTTATSAAPTSASPTSSTSTSTSSTSTSTSTTSTSSTSTTSTIAATTSTTAATTSTTAATTTTAGAPTTSSTAPIVATTVAPGAPTALAAPGTDGAPTAVSGSTGGTAAGSVAAPAGTASRFQGSVTTFRPAGGATAVTSRSAVTTAPARSGGPVTTTARRPLAKTGGMDPALPLTGATAVVVGLLLILAAGPRGAHYQPVRLPSDRRR